MVRLCIENRVIPRPKAMGIRIPKQKTDCHAGVITGSQWQRFIAVRRNLA